MVDSFLSADEALRELNETCYDCVISDYDMPGMNGLQLSRKIRANSDIPIILYTGKGSEEVAERAFTSGVNSYVRKEPTDANYKVLCQTIQNVVERHWAKRLLVESESRFRRLVEDLPLPMSVTIEDKIVFVNQKRVELTGHSNPSVIVGMSGLTFVHPDDVEKIRGRLRSRVEGSNVSSTVVYRLMCVDGSIIYVEDHMSSTLWEGKPAVLHSLVDFTERVQYEELLKVLHSYGARLERAKTVKEVAEVSLEAVRDLMLFSSASFGLVDKDKVVFTNALGLDPFNERVYDRGGSGIAVRAVNTHKTEYVKDTRLDPDYISYYKEPQRINLSELDVPVMVNGEVRAVINVEHLQVEAFSCRDAKLLELLSMHIASSLERLHEEERRRTYTKRLEALHMHAQELDKVSSLDKAAELTAIALKSILNFEYCSISMVENGFLHLKHKSVPGNIKKLNTDGAGVTVRAVRTGETQIVPDVRLDPDYVCGTNPFIMSELAVPIKVNGKVEAIINIESESLNSFTEEEVRLVEMLANRVSLLFDRIRYLEKIQTALDNRWCTNSRF